METSGSIAAMKRDPKIVKFYHSPQWKKISMNYKKSVGGLCEDCMAKGIYTPGEIVHHKIHITPMNVENPEISLDFENLKLVCRKCHAEEHGEMYGHDQRRYKVVDGRICPVDSPCETYM